MENLHYLHATGDIREAVVLGQGLPTEKGGQPCKYFWADAITEGEYTHPVKKWKLSVDRKRMDGWISNFDKMRLAGVGVTVNADHSNKAADSLGEVVGMKREEGTLKLLHQLVGEDAIRMAGRNKVSLGINADYVDGRGVAYGDAIVHSALTPIPVVPGQAGLIAASRGQSDQALIFELAAPTGDQPMVDLKKIREALGAAADVKDDELIQQAAVKLGEQKTERDGLLSRATTAEGKVEELDAKVLTLSRAPAAPDPEILRDRCENTRDKINLSMAKGDLPKVVADKLLATIPEDKPNVFMLSRSDDLGNRPMDYILSLFKDSQLGVAVGSQTTGQNDTILLSRQVPGANGDEDKKIAEAGKAQGEAYRDQQIALRKQSA